MTLQNIPPEHLLQEMRHAWVWQNHKSSYEHTVLFMIDNVKSAL
jgi:hypothetical protein